MANILEYASVFQAELDKQMVAAATSGWMEPNSNLVKYNGGNEVKIPSILMDGLGDYDRTNGFVDGSVTLIWETHKLTQDRGRTFSIDAMDVDETNFVVTAGAVLGEFQTTKVAPEVDAYRYSKIAAGAIINDKASGGYTPTKTDIISKLQDDIARVQDIVGEAEELVITMSIPVAAILSQADEVKKSLDVVDFKQGEVSFKVKAIDNIPIIRVPSARMKTAYIFNDGKTEGQETGGFVADEGAKDINWIITVRRAVLAISKTDVIRIFDPNTNQKANAWKIDYRKYHDLWIPKNKWDGIWVNCKQALT